ncbi:MAG: outer membrane beta-barrel protein [Marinibacterium sp.]|nr:outer membrane beta-barrel protein [Marinibacterium sp.]
MRRSAVFHSAVLALGLPLTVASAPAFAQDWYIQGFAGYAGLSDSTHDLNNSSARVDTEFDGGYGLGIALGRNLAELSGSNIGIRGEIELSYTDNDVDRVDFSGNGPGREGNTGGGVSSTRIFGNVLADFNTGSAIKPYLGGGIGVAFVDQDISYGGAPVRITGDDQVFSAQLIAGASYELQDGLSLFGDVRYIRDFGVEGTRRSPALVSRTDEDFETVTVNVGVRFAF